MWTKDKIFSYWVRTLCCCFICTSILALPTNGNANETSSDSLNWAFQNSSGSGFSFNAQENAKIYKFPLSYKLRNPNEVDWLVKFNFPLTIGIYNIEVEDQDIDLNVLAVVPGIELHIPLRENWILIPQVNLGLGKDTSGGHLRYIYSAGIKHHVFFDWKKFDFTFGNTLSYDGFFSDSTEDRDDFLSFSTGIDMRYPLGISLAHNPIYLSFYGVNYQYFDEVTVIESDEKTIKVYTQWELGITLSTIPDLKIFWFRIQRVGIGYRFGDGFEAVRLVFGMPF